MAVDELHCVLCNFSCSINSSSERTRTEKPHAPHFDCRKKTSFCTTGFRVKSCSLNSIHHSFGRAPSSPNEASRRALLNCRNTLAKRSHRERSFVYARFQTITLLQPPFLLVCTPSSNRLFSTLSTTSTSSTVLVLDHTKNLLITCYLASGRFWYAICLWMKSAIARRTRLKLTRRLSGHIPFNRAASRFRRVRDAIEEKLHKLD